MLTAHIRLGTANEDVCLQHETALQVSAWEFQDVLDSEFFSSRGVDIIFLIQILTACIEKCPAKMVLAVETAIQTSWCQKVRTQPTCLSQTHGPAHNCLPLECRRT